jgi:myo-inositol-1-phosphate synthase
MDSGGFLRCWGDGLGYFLLQLLFQAGVRLRFTQSLNTLGSEDALISSSEDYK